LLVTGLLLLLLRRFEEDDESDEAVAGSGVEAALDGDGLVESREADSLLLRRRRSREVICVFVYGRGFLS